MIVERLPMRIQINYIYRVYMDIFSLYIHTHMQAHVCKYIHLPTIYLRDNNGQLKYLSSREIN